MSNLIEYNENLDPPLYLISSSRKSKGKYDYFEVPDLEQRYGDITTLTIGYNKIYYRINNFNADSSRTSFSMKIQYHNLKSYPTFS